MGVTATVPLMALAPLHAPDAVQDVACVDDQAKVDGWPWMMVCGDAVKAIEGAVGDVGTGTGTATLVALAEPAVLDAVTTAATELPWSAAVVL